MAKPEKSGDAKLRAYGRMPPMAAMLRQGCLRRVFPPLKFFNQEKGGWDDVRHASESDRGAQSQRQALLLKGGVIKWG
jgi:hypothetical protein